MVALFLFKTNNSKIYQNIETLNRILGDMEFLYWWTYDVVYSNLEKNAYIDTYSNSKVNIISYNFGLDKDRAQI